MISAETTINKNFDPVSDLFIAQFAKPPGVSEVNLRTLTPFQRSLLVIDGTVTKFIEAYTMQPIEIVRLGQALRPLAKDDDWLEAEAGTPVIARHVILRGQYSGKLYVYAASLIVPNRLSDLVKQELDVEGGGIGRILLSSGLENRREVLWYGKERLVELPEEIRPLTNGEFLVRTYRIIAGGQPVMLINEKFPCDVDPRPSHH